jgi:hypothetical protein
MYDVRQGSFTALLRRIVMPTPNTRTAAGRRAAAKGSALPENHTPSEAVAHAILSESIDLTPSVNKIMNAGLSEAGCLHAITLFNDSLGVPGDPNRHPAAAIEAARRVGL